MNTASRFFFALLALALFSHLAAATIFTRDARYVGKIIAEDKDTVVIHTSTFEKPRGDDVSLNRSDILTIYDDEGTLVWSDQSIVKENSADSNDKDKVEIRQSDIKSPYRRLHVGLTGGYGIGYGNATFSSYPLGSGPDYRSAIEINASAAWYYNPSSALTCSLGGSARSIAVKNINAANLGVQGNGYWPIQFLDIRAGYRFQSDIFFLELGVLAAFNTQNVPITVETASSTTTGMLANSTQRSYAALSLALGVNVPVWNQLFIIGFVRADHGVTPAVTADIATVTDNNNNVISAAPLSLVPLAITGHLGVAWRL